MSVKRDFSGKVVLITGSSSGIGAVAAEEFSKAGAQVVITGRNAQNLANVGKRCLEVSPKSALDMFTKCTALELGPKGIRVNSVK